MKYDIIDIALANSRISVHRWLPEGEPRWIVLIVHGMGEHGGRYARFAQALNAAGAAVYAPDLPGHGLSAGGGQIGHFADHGGWALALSAIEKTCTHMRLHHRGAPLFIFGHSMGSYLTQYVLVQQGQGLAGAVLSSASGTMGPLRAIGAVILRLQCLLLGGRHRSLLAAALSFGQFNRRFPNARTRSDWLSADLAEVDKHLADPLAGQLSSARMWVDLLDAGRGLLKPARLARIPKVLPILLIVGDEDALSDGGKGSKLLADAYRAAGIVDVVMRVYPGGRHELLNDVCRDQVTADLLDWFGGHGASLT